MFMFTCCWRGEKEESSSSNLVVPLLEADSVANNASSFSSVHTTSSSSWTATERRRSQTKIVHRSTIAPRATSPLTPITSTSGFSPPPPLTSEEYRQYILEEFLTSEESYLHSLMILKEHFIDPIHSQKLLTRRTFDQIFPIDIQIIRTVNILFYNHLQEIDSGKNDHDTQSKLTRRKFDVGENNMNLKFNVDQSKPAAVQLSQLILHFSQAFRLYTGFITKYSASIDTLRGELKRPNKELNQYLKSQRSALKKKGEKCTNLNDYLIMMVQRIPRYKLLIEDLIKHTDKQSESYHSLVEAQSIIGNVALFVNTKEREYKSQNSSFDLQRSRLSLRHDFVVPNRKVIEQYIHDSKESKGIIQLIKRDQQFGDIDFYLFSDSIVFEKRYGVKKNARAFIQYFRMGTDSPYGEVIDVELEKVLDRCFKVSTQYQKPSNSKIVTREFRFVCENEQTRDHLVDLISGMIFTLQTPRSSRDSTSSLTGFSP